MVASVIFIKLRDQQPATINLLCPHKKKKKLSIYFVPLKIQGFSVQKTKVFPGNSFWK